MIVVRDKIGLGSGYCDYFGRVWEVYNMSVYVYIIFRILGIIGDSSYVNMEVVSFELIFIFL